MASSDYSATLAQARRELEEKLKQQQELEIKIRKLKQAVIALASLCEEPPTLWIPSAFDPTNSMFAGIPGLPSALAGITSLPAPVVDDLGLTDAIRAIFISQKEDWLSPTQVKEYLDAQPFFDWSSYSQPMAATHTVLKRLIENDTLESKSEGEKIFYKWKGSALRRYSRRRRNLLGSAVKVPEDWPISPLEIDRTKLK